MVQLPPPVTTWLHYSGQWNDTTGDTRTSQTISITRGRTAESTRRADPGQATLRLDNRAGTYSPHDPTSPLADLIGRNTPHRTAVDAGAPWLATSGAGPRAGTPDTPALDITGDLDVRVDLACGAWAVSGEIGDAVGKADFDADQRSWVLLLLPGGELELSWSVDGLEPRETRSSTVPVPAYNGQRIAVRATLDVDDGSGQNVTTFWTAPRITGSETWTRLGEPVTAAGTTSIFAGTAPLEIGDVAGSPFFRRPLRTYSLQVYDGIDGTLVADPDFTAAEAGDTSLTDSTGLVWTLAGGAELTNRHTRLVGEVPSWPPRRDLSGADVYVPIAPAGITRRLGSRTRPLYSPMRRELENPARSGIVAYWPCEDASDATQAASALEGHPAMRVSGDVDMAAYSDWAASEALPVMRDGQLAGDVPAYTSTNDTFVRFFVRPDPDGMAAETELISLVTTGTAARWAVRVDTLGRLIVRAYDDEGVSLYTSASINFQVDGHQISLAFELTQSGADVDWVLFPITIEDSVLDDMGNLGSGSDTVSGVTVGRVRQIRIGAEGGLADTPVGHIALANDSDAYANTNGALIGWSGERARARILRLCAEEGITASAAGVESKSIELGPQRPGQLMDLLHDAAEADLGLLLEQRDARALVYRQRSTLYSQPPALTLDYQAGLISPPLQPVDDDKLTQNDVTVRRRGGSQARRVQATGRMSVQDPPNGVGPYPASQELALYRDDQTVPVAGWLLHLGTHDGLRYTKLTLNLANERVHALAGDILQIDAGDIIRLTGLPDDHGPDPVDLMVQGYAEETGADTWTITYNCSPGDPWRVGIVGDDTLGRVSSDTSTLAGAVDEEQTTVYVVASSGWQWSTDAALPDCDIAVGGERMTVTAVAATTSGGTPATAGGDASLTAATDHVAPSVDAEGAADLLIAAWIPWDNPTEPYTIPGSMTEQAQTAGSWSRLADATEELAASGATGTRTATRAVSDTWAALAVAVSGAPDATPVIEEHLAGVDGASGDVVLTTDSGTEAGWWIVTLHGYDNGDSTPSGPEGTGWVELATSGLQDSSAPILVAHARQVDTAGAQSLTFPGGSPDDNQCRAYVLSNVTDLTGRALTVTRSVNGVNKAHSAGAEVRMTPPPTVSL